MSDVLIQIFEEEFGQRRKTRAREEVKVSLNPRYWKIVADFFGIPTNSAPREFTYRLLGFIVFMRRKGIQSIKDLVARLK